MLPTPQQMEELFRQKYGDPATTGPAPRRRYRFGHYSPADYYEATVRQAVTQGIVWLDVGGGHAIFPENPRLSKELVTRAQHVTALDPSENVLKNELVHEKVQSLLEDYQPEKQFNLATMRMVVEHVSTPDAFVKNLARLLKPEGIAVVFTVNKWSPLTLLSRVIPFRLHHPIKKMFWGGEEEDTFPVQYRMNTRHQLKKLFEMNGFQEIAFNKLDDLSVFSKFRMMNYLELLFWRCFRLVCLRYPENCLLGIYQRV
ncbi:MAG: class I SAM-dependent methyltransferase [Planctomycetia bacterium]|nr:class I SAM-dependent methyltransferase [Planctomycetia bacterium]